MSSEGGDPNPAHEDPLYPHKHPNPAFVGPGEGPESGYLAQIEGLQRELRDEKQHLAEAVANIDKVSADNKTAWRERDEMQASLKDTQKVLREAISVLAYFAGRTGL